MIEPIDDVAVGLRRQLASAGSVFVLAGPGISAESGRPTFRRVDGLWLPRLVE